MTEKAKVKGREKKRKGKVMSRFAVLAIVLSVSLASVAIVSAPAPEPEITGITVTASPISIYADGTSISTITATTTWINEEDPDDGSVFKIWFEITGDALGAVIGPEYPNTNESGVATAYLTAGPNEGTVTVKASWLRDTSFWDETTVVLGDAGETGTVDGTITYVCNETGIAGATVKLTQGGAEKYSTTTNTNGDYEFTDVTPGDYDVNASKTRFWDNSTAVTVSAGGTETADMMLLWLKGDLNNDGFVNVVDIAMLRQAVAGLIDSEWYFDLNNDGFVNVVDIAMLRQAVAGLIVLE